MTMTTTNNTTNATCPRCSGRGSINAFSHYAGGRCFGCYGSGTVRVTVSAEAPAAPAPRRVQPVNGGVRVSLAAGDVYLYADGEVIYSNGIRNRAAALTEARALAAA